METEARLDELERRLRAVEDKDEIRELAARYCVVIDHKERDALKAMFTEDSRFYSANGLMDGQGIDGVMEVLSGRWDNIAMSYHVTHGHTIELDPNDPDRATGVAASHAEVLRGGKPMRSALLYDDVYRRVDGRWRFAERKLSFYYYVEVDTFSDDLMSGKPLNIDGNPRPADLPSLL